MSGRLVILRHKSWHVWNQDNQEKVLRDERINREEELKNAAYENEQIQNKVLEDMKKGADINQETDVTNLTHVNLFEEAENQSKLESSSKSLKSNGNEEYHKEKKLMEDKRLKAAGVAPWAFGDGSYEYKKSSAWYEKPKHMNMHNVFDDFVEGEKKRHPSLDPMVGILKGGHAPVEFIESKQLGSLSSASIGKGSDSYRSTSGSKRKNDECSVERVVEVEPSMKKLKKEKKKASKKKNKKSKREEYIDEKLKFSVDDAMIQLMRLKRLEREKAESKRSQLLLARQDIYG